MDRSIDRSDTRTHTPAHTHTHTQVDAYGTQPLTVRQDTVDILVDFAASSEKGLAVVTGQHGMGKSHVMAAVGVTLEVERERETEREGERERDRQAGRQTDRQTHTHTSRS